MTLMICVVVAGVIVLLWREIVAVVAWVVVALALVGVLTVVQKWDNPVQGLPDPDGAPPTEVVLEVPATADDVIP